MGSAAPSSSQSSPELGNQRRVVFSQDPDVDWDWEEPVAPRDKISMDDVMRRTKTVAAPLPVARAAPEYNYYATLLCEICGSGDREDDLLICDGCNRGHHTFCLRPIVTQVPIGPWYCAVCAPPPAKETESFPPNQQTDEPDKGEQDAQAAETGLSQVDTTIEASNERETGSITIEKRSGEKRKKNHGGHGSNKKNLKADDDSIEFWDEFLARRAFPKGFKIEGEFESPPFIEIRGFYVTYDEFHDSFKARGLVANSVMALWSNQFNVDQHQKFKDGKTSDRKFAFSQIVTDYLSVDSASFDSNEACKKIYTKIDKTFPFKDMDLMFFPMIVNKNHWVLLCVNMSMKQIAFFDSLSASKKGSTSLKCVENLILNFSATTMKYGFLKENVSDFERSFPSGYHKQNNLIDCGMYTMDYMEAWNGEEMVASYLQKGPVLDYRKHVAQLLLESEHNTVKLDDFVKKYNGKET